MKIRWSISKALLPVAAAVMAAGAAPAAVAAGEDLLLAQTALDTTAQARKDKPAKVTPPPRPNAPTRVAAGEPPEEVKRNRHGHNELKVRGKGATKMQTGNK